MQERSWLNLSSDPSSSIYDDFFQFEKFMMSILKQGDRVF